MEREEKESCKAAKPKKIYEIEEMKGRSSSGLSVEDKRVAELRPGGGKVKKRALRRSVSESDVVAALEQLASAGSGKAQNLAIILQEKRGSKDSKDISQGKKSPRSISRSPRSSPGNLTPKSPRKNTLKKKKKARKSSSRSKVDDLFGSSSNKGRKRHGSHADAQQAGRTLADLSLSSDSFSPDLYLNKTPRSPPRSPCRSDTSDASEDHLADSPVLLRTSQTLSSSPKLRSARKSRVMRVITATSGHKAVDDSELTVTKGTVIVLRGTPEHGWCEGQVDDKVGWFPISVSEELMQESLTASGIAKSPLKTSSGSISRRTKDRKSILGKHLSDLKGPPDSESSTLASSAAGLQLKQLDELNRGIEKKNKATVINDLYRSRLSVTAGPGSLAHTLMRSPNFSELPTPTGTPRTSSVSEASGLDDDESCDDDDDAAPKLAKDTKDLFAEKPAKALRQLVADGKLSSKPEHIARFLFDSKELDKQAIGDYLGDRGDENAAVLKAYLHLLSFKDLEFDKGLRRFLYSFKLPGEAQKIDRLMEAFAHKYFLQYNGQFFQNQDVIYVLAFSTIMLNTDLHNPSIKKKMTQAEFISNNRGINDGADLPAVFLADLYQRILEDEIKTKSANDFPHALKRGYLFSGKKKHKKHWYVLDKSGFYRFKEANDATAVWRVKLDALKMLPPTIEKSQKYHPVRLMVTEDGKESELLLLATSQRLWVDWLACFEEILASR